MINRVVLLASGVLGYSVLLELIKSVDIEFIATDKKSTEIIHFATKQKIPVFVGNPRNGALYSFMDSLVFSSKILLSVNYLFLIEHEISARFEFPVNFHGSLLPKYRGRTPHVWAIINNETETGVTAHIIDEGCDTGDILYQQHVPIDSNDTGEMILDKFRTLYPIIIVKVLDLIDKGQYNRIMQDDLLATTFPKRTPDDGLIDWNWHKERIRNFVRAISYPYPGAFSIMDNCKIVIDKVYYSDIGFDNSTPNGAILSIDKHPIIKTPNGAVGIILRDDFKLHKNQILGA